jgi:hypothetical protein
MSDEYQLRRDIDRIWKSIYNLDDNSLRVVTIGESVQKIRELKSLDKIFEYYQLLDIADKMPDKVNRSEMETALSNKVSYDDVYPVGSVYSTVDDEFDPNDNFIGEWTLVDEQLFQEVRMWKRIE